MTYEEFKYYRKRPLKEMRRLFSARHPEDKVMRCLKCGVCTPIRRGSVTSIYNDVCSECYYYGGFKPFTLRTRRLNKALVGFYNYDKGPLKINVKNKRT